MIEWENSFIVARMSCCDAPSPEDPVEGAAGSRGARFSFDLVFHGALLVLVAGLTVWGVGAAMGRPVPWIGAFAEDFTRQTLTLFGQMAWGMVLAFVVVGLMHRVPRDYVAAVLGRGDTFGGLVRAAIAGLALDLCSHGILMVAAKLYERGASLAQIMTFLVASPWNSFSLTLILITLIGLKWTIMYLSLIHI